MIDAATYKIPVQYIYKICNFLLEANNFIRDESIIYDINCSI